MNLKIFLLLLLLTSFVKFNDVSKIEMYYIDLDIVFRHSMIEDSLPKLSFSNKITFNSEKHIKIILEDLKLILKNKKELNINSIDSRILIKIYSGKIVTNKIAISITSYSDGIIKFDEKYYNLSHIEFLKIMDYIPKL